jgi:hypothetical protein
LGSDGKYIPAIIDLCQWDLIETQIREKCKELKVGWVTVDFIVFTNNYNVELNFSKKNYDTYQRYSKFYYDRWSGSGFKVGIPNALDIDFPISSDDLYFPYVSVNGLKSGKRPFIFRLWLHILLCLTGFSLVSILIVYFCMPSRQVVKVEIKRIGIPH